MKNSSLLVLVLAVSALAAPARAQSVPDTTSNADEARSQTTSAAGSHQSDRLVRLIDFAERQVEQYRSPRDGIGLRFGGITSGSDLAVGPLWQTHALDGAVRLRASAAASMFRDYDVETGVAIPEVRTHRVSLSAGALKRHLAREHFYGLGMSSSATNKTTFELDRSEAHMEASLLAASWLTITGGGGWVDLSAADSNYSPATSISTQFDRRSAPGLGLPATFGVLSASAVLDWRDIPGNPRNGGRFQLSVDRHSDQSGHQYSFSSATLDVEQHFSWWRRQRVLSLRGRTAVAAPDTGNDVPFYLQPTLGGSRVLRGFATDRFRDRSLVWAQAEYGWDLWPFLGTVLFYEAGAVASEPAALGFKDLKRDYGIGFRIGSARTIAVRTDVAFGSGEGTRIAMRFSHAF